MKTVDNQMTWGLILLGLQLQHKSYNSFTNDIIQIYVHYLSIIRRQKLFKILNYEMYGHDTTYRNFSLPWRSFFIAKVMRRPFKIGYQKLKFATKFNDSCSS